MPLNKCKQMTSMQNNGLNNRQKKNLKSFSSEKQIYWFQRKKKEFIVDLYSSDRCRFLPVKNEFCKQTKQTQIKIICLKDILADLNYQKISSFFCMPFACMHI